MRELADGQVSRITIESLGFKVGVEIKANNNKDGKFTIQSLADDHAIVMTTAAGDHADDGDAEETTTLLRSYGRPLLCCTRSCT